MENTNFIYFNSTNNSTFFLDYINSNTSFPYSVGENVYAMALINDEKLLISTYT